MSPIRVLEVAADARSSGRGDVADTMLGEWSAFSVRAHHGQVIWRYRHATTRQQRAERARLLKLQFPRLADPGWHSRTPVRSPRASHILGHPLAVLLNQKLDVGPFFAAVFEMEWVER